MLDDLRVLDPLSGNKPREEAFHDSDLVIGHLLERFRVDRVFLREHGLQHADLRHGTSSTVEHLLGRLDDVAVVGLVVADDAHQPFYDLVSMLACLLIELPPLRGGASDLVAALADARGSGL